MVRRGSSCGTQRYGLGKNSLWGKWCFWFMFLILSTGCISGSPVRTKAYTWRSEVYSHETKKQDWFVLPPQKKKRQEAQKQLGFCAAPSVKPYLKELKKLTRRCVELSHTFHRAAGTFRAGYYALITTGLIGGTAVLSAPIFTVVKVPDAPFDPSILLTVVGASITAASLLWLQVGAIGKTANQSFKKYADLVRLIQNAEIQWQSRVCHATSIKLARVQAEVVLKGLATQCVKDVPKVNVNPNIFKQLDRQQSNINNVLTKYQALQEHMDTRTELRESQKTLRRLVERINKTHNQMNASVGTKALQAQQTLIGLCAQARSEHERLTSLQNELTLRSSPGTNRKTTRSAGSWVGSCKMLRKRKQRLLRATLLQNHQESQKRLNKLIQTIEKYRIKIVLRRSKVEFSRAQQELRLACAQAKAEHLRLQSLWLQLVSKQQAQQIPPGAWLGTCKVLASQRYTQPPTSNPSSR